LHEHGVHEIVGEGGMRVVAARLAEDAEVGVARVKDSRIDGAARRGAPRHVGQGVARGRFAEAGFGARLRFARIAQPVLDHGIGQHRRRERRELAGGNEVGPGELGVKRASKAGREVKARSGIAVVDVNEEGAVVHV
jgi:hypothetical protein